MKEARRTTAVCQVPDTEVDLTESISLDFDSIPDFVKGDLALTALDAVMIFLKRPDAQEILNRERELLRLEGSTLLDPRPQKLKGATL